MTPDALANELAAELRNLYIAHPDGAEERIEALLKQRLSAQGAPEAEAVMRQVIGHLRKPQQTQAGVDSQIMTRMFSLLLGRKVEPDDLSSTALLERLAESLNTIFNALNQLISVINISFSGGAQSGDQTIRQFIGFHLGGEDQTKSLEDYLGQINQAFLMTHEAFKKAAQSKVRQIMHAIDPAKLATERSSGLKLGPMRKAEDFDNLKTKIERIQKWFDSGRFMEDFLREFETNCQQYNRKDRR
jgi:hypothetical protein